jgi:type IV pilus assembly protein PilB
MGLQNRKKLGVILFEQGDLSRDQLKYVMEKRKTVTERFGEICVNDGMVTEEAVSRALAEQFGFEFVDLQGFKIDEAILSEFPPDVIYRLNFVPLYQEDKTLVIAIADPTDIINLDELEMLLDRPLKIKVAAKSQIAQIIKRGEGTSRVLKEVSEDFMLQLVTETEKGEEVLSVEKVSADTSPIIKLVNSTILDALTKRASDIHIETAQEGVVIKYRIDGVLYRATEPIDIHFQGPVISRLKI